MFELECKLYRFLHGYATKLVDDLDDARMADRPAPGMNPPAWILGHLTIAADVTLQLLGRTAVAPEGWMTRFGPGSSSLELRDAYPSKSDLWAGYAAGHEAVVTAVGSSRLDAAALERPHGLELAFLKELMPQTGLLIAHLLTTHEAIHLGQLSAWRRGMGMEGVLKL